MKPFIEMKQKHKPYDSSITRVQPVLKHLLHTDSPAETRLSQLLQITPRGKTALSESVRSKPGKLVPWCMEESTQKKSLNRPLAFEKTVAPSKKFLKWLLENPKKLNPPDLGKAEETIERRKALLGRESCYNSKETLELALRHLSEEGAEKSRRKWWALEGFTHVDCLIETESLVLFIEGKRTEKAGENVSWFPQRNQIARNLECAKARAVNKEFAVLMVIEEGVNEKHHYDSVRARSFLKSWPHLKDNPENQGELLDAFLGIVTWQDILKCWNLDEAVTLPETVTDAEPF